MLPPVTASRNKLRIRSLCANWRAVLCWTLVMSVGVVLALRSWRKWCDLLVDFGHELYIPWRMSAGDVLYRDIVFTMGPLSQYFHELLFRVFGPSLLTLVVSNLVILAVFVWLIVQVFTDAPIPVADVGAAEIAGASHRFDFSPFGIALVFLVAFAFSQYALIGNFNYVTPYRHEVTHGLALGLGSLVAWLGYLRTNQWWRAVLGVVLLGLTWLTKLEMFVPALTVSMIAVLTMMRRDRTVLWRILPLCLGALVAPSAIAWTLLAVQLGPTGATDALLINLHLSLNPELTTRSGFYRVLSGIDRPAEQVKLMGQVWLVFGGGALVVWLADRMLAKFRGAWFAGVVLGLCCAYGLLPTNVWLSSRLIPGFLFGALFWRAVQWVRMAPGAEWRLMFAAFAGALVLKVALNPQFGHYGFALLMPGTLMFAHWLTVDIPDVLKKQGAGWLWQGAAVGVVIGVCGWLGFSSDRVYQAKTAAFGSGLDQYFVDPRNDERSLATLAVVSKVQSAIKPGETLFAAPEGTTINYLLRAVNPSGVLMANPWESAAYGSDRAFWNRIQAKPADWVLIIQMDMSIHGHGQLGDPMYGREFIASVKRDYRMFAREVVRGRGGAAMFQIVAYRRIVE